MLRIKDSNGRTKFVLRDEDEEPVPVDELVLNDTAEGQTAKETQEKKNGSNLK